MLLSSIILKAGAFYMRKGHKFPRVKGNGSQSVVPGPEAGDQHHQETCQTCKLLGPAQSY